MNAQEYPTDLYETLTAVSVYAAIDLGQTPKTHPVIREQVELILKSLPEWGESSADFYGWYHGTYALFHYGGRGWKTWNGAMKLALLAAQETDKNSHEYGSFSTDCAWSVIGGRVYTTAIAALTFEVYLRGAPILD